MPQAAPRKGENCRGGGLSLYKPCPSFLTPLFQNKTATGLHFHEAKIRAGR
jgi:hypothetical protein